MKIEGAYTIAAPRESVWYCLREANILVQAVPGCQFWQVGADEIHRSSVEMQIGPMQGMMHNTLRLEDEAYLEQYQFQFNSEGSPGQVAITGQITLAENGRFTTIVTYKADVTVSGRLAGLNDRLLTTALKSFFRQTLAGLNRQLGGEPETAVAAPSDTAPTPPPWLPPLLLLLGLLLIARLLANKKSEPAE